MAILTTTLIALLAGVVGAAAAGVGKGITNASSGGNYRQSGEQVAQNEFNANEAQKQRDFEAAEAQKVRDWETQMSNTAVQRQVSDMQAAGINPAMAYAGSASGASTPSGAMAHGNSASGASAMGGYNGMANLLQAGANVAQVMNNDKVKGNNMNAAGVTSIVLDIAKLIGK